MVDPIAARMANALNGNLRTNDKVDAVKRASVKAASETTYSLPKLVLIARDLAKMGPPIDLVKIASIRQAIADGNYKIDPQRIADSMLNYYHSSETP